MREDKAVEEKSSKQIDDKAEKICAIKKVTRIVEQRFVLFLTKRFVKNEYIRVSPNPADSGSFIVDVNESKIANWVFERIQKLYKDKNMDSIHAFLVKVMLGVK